MWLNSGPWGTLVTPGTVARAGTSHEEPARRAGHNTRSSTAWLPCRRGRRSGLVCSRCARLIERVVAGCKSPPLYYNYLHLTSSCTKQRSEGKLSATSEEQHIKDCVAGNVVLGSSGQFPHESKPSFSAAGRLCPAAAARAWRQHVTAAAAATSVVPPRDRRTCRRATQCHGKRCRVTRAYRRGRMDNREEAHRRGRPEEGL